MKLNERFKNLNYKTSIIKKTKSPQWNENFKIPIIGEYKSIEIKIQVKDHDTIGKVRKIKIKNKK